MNFAETIAEMLYVILATVGGITMIFLVCRYAAAW
jgi:hypothetical protein